jgi:hypothetical protein
VARGLSLSGFGIGVLLAILQLGGVKVPASLLWICGVLAFVLVVAGVADTGIQRHRRVSVPPAPEPAVQLSFASPSADAHVTMMQRRVAPAGGYSGATISLSASATSAVGLDYEDETRLPSFVFARVFNDQCSPGVGVMAKDVRCYLSFFSTTNAWRLAEMRGRWRDSDSPLSLLSLSIAHGLRGDRHSC